MTKRQKRLTKAQLLVNSDSDDSGTDPKEVMQVVKVNKTVTHQPIPAPVFDDMGNVDQFIENYEAIAKHNGWPEEENRPRLQISLRGAASCGVQGDSCADVYRKLRSQYDITAETASALLKTLKLRTKDKIHPFGETGHPLILFQI